MREEERQASRRHEAKYEQRPRRGGWYGDPAGHARAAERGWEERHHEGGRAYSARRAGDEPDQPRADYSLRREQRVGRNYERSGSERGHRGWFGDPARHARASEKGWERSDHGRSGWYGDPAGHSRASEKGWEERGHARRSCEDDDHGHRGRASGNGRRGWHGDPRGPAEAVGRASRDR
jgi:hypothetical protein